MGKKRKRWPFDVKNDRRKLKAQGIRIPPGAIAADPSEQGPNNSWSIPSPLFYEDYHFTCVDCGASEIWTGKQQKWYYEVAKGSVHAKAIRCRECRKAHRAQKGKGDPNPIKHLGSLMKHLRKAIDPAIESAGFRFEKQSNFKLRSWRLGWIEYSRQGTILRCTFDGCRGRLVAESFDDEANSSEVVSVDSSGMRGTRDWLFFWIDAFAVALSHYLNALPPSSKAEP